LDGLERVVRFGLGRLDAKGPAMNFRSLRKVFFAFFLTMAFVAPVSAHLGSPDVFFDGAVGPYTVHATIRMPVVVPGQAGINIHVLDSAPVRVAYLPLYSKTAVTNAPPPDEAQLVRGETNLFTGQLWLMQSGAYSVEIKIQGAAGDATLQIPVNSQALSQLPLPPYLRDILVALGALLVFGGMAIVAGAVRESVLAPETAPEKFQRRKGWRAGAVALAIFALFLWRGGAWWHQEENNYRRHLRGGGWPDLTPSVQVSGNERVLDFIVGKKDLPDYDSINLAPDHGKLMHLFLIREGVADVFAHLHPVRKRAKEFQVALPPLPAGRYKILCDLTFEQSGTSYTATNSIELPAAPEASASTNALQPDDDDTWTIVPAQLVAEAKNSSSLEYALPDGLRVVWKTSGPLRANEDAGLQFEVWDAAGNGARIEPYMGMAGHTMVWRRDGAVFAHLHPAGNFSSASEAFFQQKLASEGKSPGDAQCGPTQVFAKLPPGQPAIISFPYEFPQPGDYRVWVQFKSGGKIYTAVFDRTVSG
jgi:hypothetical protein